MKVVQQLTCLTLGRPNGPAYSTGELEHALACRGRSQKHGIGQLRLPKDVTTDAAAAADDAESCFAFLFLVVTRVSSVTGSLRFNELSVEMFKVVFLTRDAVFKRGLCRRALAGWLGVCLSHSCIRRGLCQSVCKIRP